MSIVTNGLVYYNDAANTLSYARSGTTINDLSISSYPLIMASNATYNPSYGGYFGFIGTSAFASGSSTPPTSLNNLTSATWTSWMNIPYENSGSVLYKSDASFLGGWYTLFGNPSSISIPFNGFGFDIVCSGNDSIGAIPTGSYPIGSWFSATIVWDGSLTFPNNSSIYINGKKVAFSFTRDGSGIHNTDATYPLRICSGTAFGTNGASVNSSIQMIHNRALSQAEVVQNYNDQKARFGL
jgi:hypothetical protein